MIKQLLHKVFSISLALIVLCSTVSFTIEKHFCGNKLVDVSLFSQADKCNMGALEMEADEINKKSCCKDKIDVVEGQDELIVKSFDDLDADLQQFITTFAFAYFNRFEGLPQLVVPHKNYSPPILVFDKQITDQVFLI